MAYPELTRRVAFAAKLETTIGTDSVPTLAANAIRLLEPPTIEPVFLAENMTDDVVTGKLGTILMAAPGGKAWRIRGRAPAIGRGTAYGAAAFHELDPLLVAAGLTRTATTTPGAEKLDYDPSDDPTAANNTTVSAYLWMDGKRYILTYGVIEEMTFRCDAAGFPEVQFSLIGIAGTTTEAALSAATYTNVVFPIWKGASSLVISGATNVRPRSFELGLGLSAVARANANATDGHAGFRVTRRLPELKIRCEVPALADWDPAADWAARTLRTIDFAIGATQYNRMKIDIDDARVINVVTEDDSDLRVYDITYRIAMPVTGNELRLTWD